MKQPDPLWEVQKHPVFRHRLDVLTWRNTRYDDENFEPRFALSYEPFLWKVQGYSGHVITDNTYKVRYDHKYPKSEQYTLFLLPANITNIPIADTIYLDVDQSKNFGLD